MEAKSYFQQPTAAEIRKYSSVREISDHLVDNILGLGNEEAVVISRRLVPLRYEGPRMFMKHGADVRIRRFSSLEEAVDSGLTPLQLRKRVFDRVGTSPYSCYSFRPFTGSDRRTRRVPLIECLEGAKIYCYASGGEKSGQFVPFIEATPYDIALRVEREGAEIIVTVPSRTKKRSKYEFKFSSVPVADSGHKQGITYGIATNHSCKGKMFDIRYKLLDDKESSRVFTFCAHEVAGYLALIDYYWTKKQNLIPLLMSPFAIPTQETVDYYNRLCRNCLIKTPEDKKSRKLNRAEKEILLWGLVHKLKHDRTFFAREKVREYKWR